MNTTFGQEASELSGRDWDEAEVRATVETYLDMLARELKGEPYSKAAHRRRLMSLLPGRSEPAVERKHMNISAVLRDAGMPFVEGYKPLGNYQALLAQVVHERLAGAQSLLGEVVRIADEPAPNEHHWRTGDPSLEVPRPEPVIREKGPSYTSGPPGLGRYDFPARDAANRALGEQGEKFVLEVEKKRLVQAGHPDLAKGVRWVSKDEGDGAGYDIRSFDLSGFQLMVEVKTTNHNRRFAFIVTRNEVRVSEQIPDSYRLYRVFHFARDPRFFVLPGALSQSCSSLDPRSYTATP